MKSLIIYALTTSATFLAFSNQVNAKDCPSLPPWQITVTDPNKDIALRTDPNKIEQDTSKTGGTRAVVNAGDTLLTLGEEPQFNANEATCYYAVELGPDNKSNTEAEVLNYKPYWISKEGIKNYSNLVAAQKDLTTTSASKKISFPVLFIIIPVIIVGGILIFFVSLRRHKNRFSKDRFSKARQKDTSQLKPAPQNLRQTMNQKNRKLWKEVPNLEIENVETSKQDFAQLQQTIQQLKTELDTLKKLVANPIPISADAYQPLLSESPPPLQLPLSRVIDLYRECPEILEAYVQRVTIDKKHFSLDGNTNSDQPLTFQANGNGNFWVIQLEKQGSFLFTRPNDTKRINLLSLLNKIFKLNGNNKGSDAEFDVVKPAKLAVVRLQTSWRLEKQGELSYAQIPLNYQWQQELTSIRQQQEATQQTIKTLEENNKGLDWRLSIQELEHDRQKTDLRQQHEKIVAKLVELMSTNISKQETIDYLLKLTEYLDAGLQSNQRYTEEIIKIFEYEQKINNEKQQIVGKFFIARNKLKEESKKISKPQNKEHIKQIEGLNDQIFPNNQMFSLVDLGIGQGGIQEIQENSGHDPFYNEVIAKFNAYNELIAQFNAQSESVQWFLSQIENRIFTKIQITKNSVLGQMDMGGKVTQLELNQQGTLLIYQADNKFWVIPDQTQSRWKRCITESLFSGSRDEALIRPAEVESVGDNLWQLVEKGEFR